MAESILQIALSEVLVSLGTEIWWATTKERTHFRSKGERGLAGYSSGGALGLWGQWSGLFQRVRPWAYHTLPGPCGWLAGVRASLSVDVRAAVYDQRPASRRAEPQEGGGEGKVSTKLHFSRRGWGIAQGRSVSVLCNRCAVPSFV